MELPLLLFYGGIAGIAAGTLAAIMAPLFVDAGAKSGWRERRLSVELTALLVHLVAGCALGFLFWLSWGLTALVNVPWWQRGLAFGLLTWLALNLPLVLAQNLHARIAWQISLKLAIDWLLTCVAVGLACAYSWQNGR